MSNGSDCVLLQLTRGKEGYRRTGPGEPLVDTSAYLYWTCMSACGLELCPRHMRSKGLLTVRRQGADGAIKKLAFFPFWTRSLPMGSTGHYEAWYEQIYLWEIKVTGSPLHNRELDMNQQRNFCVSLMPKIIKDQTMYRTMFLTTGTERPKEDQLSWQSSHGEISVPVLSPQRDPEHPRPNPKTERK